MSRTLGDRSSDPALSAEASQATRFSMCANSVCSTFRDAAGMETLDVRRLFVMLRARLEGSPMVNEDEPPGSLVLEAAGEDDVVAAAAGVQADDEGLDFAKRAIGKTGHR